MADWKFQISRLVLVICFLLITSVLSILFLSRIQSASLSVSHQGMTPKESTTDFDMETCLTDVLHHLPVGEGTKRLKVEGRIGVFAHHWDAQTGFWNQDIRFDPLPQLNRDSCIVWEVGAHENAADTQILMKSYPKCTYHAYEPVPLFYEKLNRKWAMEKHVVTHNYGLASEDGMLAVSQDALQGQSTYISEKGGQSTHRVVNITIKSFDFALSEAGGRIPDLLHVNCEGCEWEMMPQAKSSHFLDQIPVINLGTHNYPNNHLGKRSLQLCQIRKLLSETHTMVKGIPFGWERWVLKS